MAVPQNMLELYDITTSSRRYPDRPVKWPLTQSVANNAAMLVDRLNRLAMYWASAGKLGKPTPPLSVSSGYRPADVNRKTNGAATNSLHLICAAADLVDDKSQALAKFCLADLPMLEHLGLWIENPEFTRGRWTNWVHLQIFPPKSGKRVFDP